MVSVNGKMSNCLKSCVHHLVRETNLSLSDTAPWRSPWRKGSLKTLEIHKESWRLRGRSAVSLNKINLYNSCYFHKTKSLCACQVLLSLNQKKKWREGKGVIHQQSCLRLVYSANLFLLNFVLKCVECTMLAQMGGNQDEYPDFSLQSSRSTRLWCMFSSVIKDISLWLDHLSLGLLYWTSKMWQMWKRALQLF